MMITNVTTMQLSTQQEIRILHVDDDPSITDLTGTFLEREDDRFAVETATSADEGLQRTSDRPPDCVVSDYDMPRLDGIEFLQAVREEYPDLPFILFTGEGSETVASDAIAADVTDYLQKKSGTEQYELLANRIENAVEARREVKRADRQEQLMQLTEVGGDTGGFEVNTETGDMLLTDGARQILNVPEDATHSAGDTLEMTEPALREEIRQTMDQAAETGEQTHGMWPITIPNGEQRLLDVTYTQAVPDEDDATLRGAIRDITGRKEREQKLDLVETLFEHVEECQFIVDVADGEFELRHANQYYKRTVGLPANTPVTGETPVELFAETGGQQVLDRYRRCVETQDSVNYTVELPVPEEGTVYRTILTPVTTDGEVTHIVGTARDITGRMDRQQELERQNERLEEFASIVSHDLRNPLRVADGRLELARNECESAHIDDVAQALDRMDALIEDLLTLAREGHRVDETESVELATVATNSWETVDTAQATLETDTTRAVEADRSRLQQLFENLYRNAIEHGGDDVTVSVGAIDDGFYVADTGPGIPPPDREDVFEAGYSTSEDGTGLGLRIVERIADAHGWEITVTESENGEGGARFEFTGVEVGE